jgi:hypothetical protein
MLMFSKSSMASLQKYRSRPPNALFDALPYEIRQRALFWVTHLCSRWGK